jgi:hypothetical protein
MHVWADCDRYPVRQEGAVDVTEQLTRHWMNLGGRGRCRFIVERNLHGLSRRSGCIKGNSFAILFDSLTALAYTHHVDAIHNKLPNRGGWLQKWCQLACGQLVR